MSQPAADPTVARSEAFTAGGVGARALFALLFLFVGGYGNFFAIWLEDLGWDDTTIGWQQGLYTACLLAGPLAWGHVGDVLGRPVRVLRLITIGSAAAFVAFSLTTAVIPLLVATVAFGAFRTGMVTTTDAYTLVHVDRHGGDYGRVRIWGSLGFIVGSFGLGALVHHLSRGAVPVALLAVLVATALLTFALPDEPAPTRSQSSLGDSVRRLLRDPRTRSFYVVTFVNRLASQGLYIFLPLHLSHLGVDDAWIPAWWTVGVVSEIVLMRNAPRLFGRIRPARVLTLCFGLGIAQYGLTAMITDPIWLLPVMALHGMTFGIWYYSSVTWLSRNAPEGTRTRALGLFQSLGFGAGGFLSAIASGYLFDAGGGALLFAVAAGLAVPTTVLAWRTLVMASPPAP